MKYSLGISNFLKEISRLSHSIIFLFFFSLITEEDFLISPCHSLELCIQMGISFLFWLNNSTELNKDFIYIYTITFTINIFKLHDRGNWRFSSVKSLSHVWLFETPWSAARQATLSITNSWSLQTHVHWVGDAIQLSHSLSSPSSPAINLAPASGSSPVSQLFPSGGQSIGVSASASVLPMNIQDWSSLGWTGWISLQSKGLRVFSNTTVQKHQVSGAQLSFIVTYFIRRSLYLLTTSSYLWLSQA